MSLSSPEPIGARVSIAHDKGAKGVVHAQVASAARPAIKGRADLLFEIRVRFFDVQLFDPDVSIAHVVSFGLQFEATRYVG